MTDYNGKLIHKMWGFEWQAFDNGAAAVWILHIATKRKTSLHCHPNKKTTLVVLNGNVRFTWGEHPQCQQKILKPLDVQVIEKGVYHQSEAATELDGYPTAEDGCWLMEIEEPSDKEDLVRAQDDYGRVGKPYETEVVPYSGELLQLSEQNATRFLGYVFQLKRIGWNRNAICIPVSTGYMLEITKDHTMKLSDYIANTIADYGVKHVFGVVGGGSMHLNDSFGHHDRLSYVACHHEQAAAMAAESYARINGLGCCLVTTGPGGTNAITGVACAWVDSIPVVFISGQVTRETMIGDSDVRQLGIQETNIVELVRPITKYAVTITDEKMIRHELEKAIYIAKSGRPGPVWIDIPLDVQPKMIEPESLLAYSPLVTDALMKPPHYRQVEDAIAMLQSAQRPALIVGNGVRLAGGQDVILPLIDALGIPVISSWTASDMIGEHPYHIGHMGIFGDRASNFAVQNADLLLVIGSRLSVPMMGYNREAFAPNAKIIMVDVDMAEMKKPSLHVDLPIVADAKEFIETMVDRYPQSETDRAWLDQCQQWRQQYPVVLPEYADTKDGINSYHFIDRLSAALPEDAIVVTDMGSAFTCTFQTAKMKRGQRWLTASGHVPMGYALPGAIGAHYATGKRVVCIVGDGSLQFNIQEFAIIAHNKLPITIFVLNNGGYLTIKHMQLNHFGRYVGSEESSGVWCPDLMAIGGAYNIEHIHIGETSTLWARLYEALNADGPMLCEIMMPPHQPLIPRNSSKKMPDGSIVSAPLDDMFPFLPRDEYERTKQ